MGFIATELPLGIDFAEIGLHILNFIILLVALYLLLYKPVKKFIKKRQEGYQAAEDESKKNAEDTLKIKEGYIALMEHAHEDALKISEEAHASALVKEEQLLSEAKEDADKVRLDAKEDAKNIKRQAKEEVATSVASLAVSLASEIMSREVEVGDSDLSIEKIIKDWKDGEGRDA